MSDESSNQTSIDKQGNDYIENGYNVEAPSHEVDSS